MTGFTKWLGKVFCVQSSEDLWRERDKSRLSLLLPSRFKVHIRNERVLGECCSAFQLACYHCQCAFLLIDLFFKCTCIEHVAV